jgi:hypothetical protein
VCDQLMPVVTLIAVVFEKCSCIRAPEDGGCTTEICVCCSEELH